MLAEAGERLPLADLCRHGLACAGTACGGWGPVSGKDEAGVLVTEWDVLARTPALAAARTHLVAVDPPYRRDHVALVNSLGEQGVNVHLYYGHDERQATARLLRYLVHPRFAMVCVYRALEATEAEEGRSDVTGHGRLGATGSAGRSDAEIVARAAGFAWSEAQVILETKGLSRALAVLRELDLGRQPVGEAKLEAHSIPAYVEAEAEYEECSRLCLNL
jgi:hypothetical protein